LALAAEAEWKMPKLRGGAIVEWAPGPGSREWSTFIVGRINDRSIGGLLIQCTDDSRHLEFKGNASYHLDPMIARLPERIKDEDAGVWREGPWTELISLVDLLGPLANNAAALMKKVDEHEQMLRQITEWLEENGPNVRRLREEQQAKSANQPKGGSTK